MTDDVAAAVRGFLLEEVVEDQGTDLSKDDPLLQGILDSWALMQLIGFIEERFDVSVLPHEVVERHFGSIDAITAFVGEKLSERSA